MLLRVIFGDKIWAIKGGWANLHWALREWDLCYARTRFGEMKIN
jgi:hypothetical protein